MHSNTPDRSIDRAPSPVDTKLHATAQRAIARDLPQSTDNAPDEHPTHNLFLVSPDIDTETLLANASVSRPPAKWRYRGFQPRRVPALHCLGHSATDRPERSR